MATSRQYGIEPQQLVAYLQENNQLPAMFADVRRALAIAEVIRAATVTDTAGNTVDTDEFFGKRAGRTRPPMTSPVTPKNPRRPTARSDRAMTL